ncbi:hypothetical protein Mboo_0797 [Methanoregula boonei 6A8]|uniref:DUF3821 domain-containing protein n=1 Tax=Methanoregula boonei (strain DSM 21154 / JCM 14090 / 6A8) TaxID=456442 RepID=A7I6F4_METB6|nr:hypothetical protein [Methanoregula boonei]ABS55315.1 hypothetical protein Mboo_0797 [Methanoregula boonei 6A8]
MDWIRSSILTILIFFLLIIPSGAELTLGSNMSFPNGTNRIYLDPVENQYFGGTPFTVNGTTNLEVGTAITAAVYYDDWSPCSHSGCGPTSGMTETIYVAEGEGFLNKTYFTINTSEFIVGDYLVSESTKDGEVNDSKSFTLSVPPDAYFTIDPIGTRYAGGIFYISGTTNLPLSDLWVGWIYSKSNPDNLMIIAPGMSDLSTTQESSGIIRWSVNATNTTENLEEGEYYAVVGINHVASKTIGFTLLPAANEKISNYTPTTITAMELPTPVIAPPSTATTRIPPATTNASGFSGVITVIGLLAITLITTRRY